LKLTGLFIIENPTFFRKGSETCADLNDVGKVHVSKAMFTIVAMKGDTTALMLLSKLVGMTSTRDDLSAISVISLETSYADISLKWFKWLVG